MKPKHPIAGRTRVFKTEEIARYFEVPLGPVSNDLRPAAPSDSPVVLELRNLRADLARVIRLLEAAAGSCDPLPVDGVPSYREDALMPKPFRPNAFRRFCFWLRLRISGVAR